MARDALIAIIAEVAEAVGWRVVGKLDSFPRVHAFLDVVGCHLDDLLVVAAHAELLGQDLRDLTAAAAELTRNRDQRMFFHLHFLHDKLEISLNRA